MATKVISAEEQQRNKQEERQNKFEAFLTHYVENYDGPRRMGMTELIYWLLGADAAGVEDEFFEMKSTFINLLAFFADSTRAADFEKESTFYSGNYIEHLKRVLFFLTDAHNPYTAASVALHEMEGCLLNDKDMASLQKQFGYAQ